MPYVDTTPANFSIKLTEGNFQEKFADLLTQYGWNGGVGGTSVALKFLKVVSQRVIASHYIFKNADGKMFGMAVLAKVTIDPDDMGTTDAEKLAYYKDMFKNNKSNTRVYFYMLEKLPTKVANDSFVEIGTPDSVTSATGATIDERVALDIEVNVTYTEQRIDANTGKPYYVTHIVPEEAEPMVMQSPIVKSELRSTALEYKDFPVLETNWWDDSEIRVQGFIDENNVFVIIQADNVPAWENNIVPTVPFYFGKIDPIDPGDNAVAMFAGTVPTGGTETTIGNYDFNSTHPTGTKILPVLKTYPKHPSNGVDSVMVSRSKFGSRYQEYFLSWNTAPNAMEPDREGVGGKKYPRAWNNIYSNEYKYQFNPSRYSGKVHTSKIYLVHPEEGVRGSLSNAIGLSALNFNAGKLRIRKQNCPDKIYDVYRFFMVGAVSPLTKRPATHYRPMGLGIYDSEYNPNN